MENGPFIVSFPWIAWWIFPVRYVSHYQRVPPVLIHFWLGCSKIYIDIPSIYILGTPLMEIPLRKPLKHSFELLENLWEKLGKYMGKWHFKWEKSTLKIWRLDVHCHFWLSECIHQFHEGTVTMWCTRLNDLERHQVSPLAIYSLK